MNFKEFYINERRQYVAKHIKDLMYHGTTNKNLKSILSSGLVSVNKKVWDSDKQASYYNPSRTSYGGIYFTNNLLTAISSGRNAVDKLGGDSIIIICAELQPRSALPDEDNFKFKIEQALQYAIGYGGKYAGDSEKLTIETLFDLVQYNKEFKEKLNWFIEDFKKMVDFENSEVWPKDIEKEFKNKLEKLFIAAINRRVSYIDNYNIKKELSSLLNISFDSNEINKYLIDKTKAENNYKDAIIDIMNTLKKQTYKNIDDVNKTYRIINNIGFSGANKIICVVELKNYLYGSEKEKELVIHYGKLPEKFITNFKERITDKFKIRNVK